MRELHVSTPYEFLLGMTLAVSFTLFFFFKTVPSVLTRTAGSQSDLRILYFAHAIFQTILSTSSTGLWFCGLLACPGHSFD